MPHYKGARYDVITGRHRPMSESRTLVDLVILDKRTGRKYMRVGDARQIGNHAPIYVSWKGKRVNVERFLNSQGDAV